MEGDSQHQHGGPPQLGAGALRLIAALVQMGDRPVQRQQEQDAQPKSDDGGEEGPLAHASRLFYGGNQQAPDGRRHHNPCRKAGQGPLNQQVHTALEKKYAPRTQCGSQKGEKQFNQYTFCHFQTFASQSYSIAGFQTDSGCII